MGKTERSNGAFGKSDIEGKVARVAARKRGRDRVSNGREHMNQCGQRASFNLAVGTPDLLGLLDDPVFLGPVPKRCELRRRLFVRSSEMRPVFD
jgi:hypothetical protein